MKRLSVKIAAAAPLLALSASACAPLPSQHERILGSEQSQLALRQMQTRAFDTTDRAGMLRTIMATMQDLGFVIDKADEELGMVTGTKLHGYAIRLTATVRPRGRRQLLVRVNAQYNRYTIEQLEPYQQFFAALENALFLTAEQVD